MARGSVFKRGGGWAFRIDAGIHPETGKRRQILRQGFSSKTKAEAALVEVQQAVSTGTIVMKSSMRLEQYLDEWLASQACRLRDTTLYSYEIAARRLRKHLGQCPLQAITPLQIEKFYADLLTQGCDGGRALSPKTVKNTHIVLRKALADAERLGLVQRNAAAAARGPAVRPPEFIVWSASELREFLDQAHGSRLHSAYLVLATTGMRRGEVLGLRWSDIDFESSELAIIQTVNSIGGKAKIGQPKTSRSRRRLYVADTTMKALQAHRERQSDERLAAGSSWDRSLDLVFADQFGGMVKPDWFSREFERIAEAAGVPRIRLHDVRHTNATLALKAGIHPKVVSERLGHSSISVTLDLYSHVTPGIAREAAAAVESEIFG